MLSLNNHETIIVIKQIASSYSCATYHWLLIPIFADEETPRQREVAVISQMYTDISNYWLFAYRDTIVLLGGLCTVQVRV